jgi:hypothetical protein
VKALTSLWRGGSVLLLLGLLSAGCGAHNAPHPDAGSPTQATMNTVAFRDKAQAAGLTYRWIIPGPRPLTILQTMGWGCAFLDFNNDGNLDLLLVGPKLALYQGDGHGHFTDVTHPMGLDKLKGYFQGCAVGDYDNDGYDDLYISGYQTGVLLHNEGGKRFVDVTKEAGLQAQPWGSSAAFGDIDNDGLLDLYIGNYVQFGPNSPQLCHNSSCAPSYYPALRGVLYHNVGHGHFEEVTKQWNAQNVSGKTLGVAFADYNASGKQSLILANDEVAGNFLKNIGGKFTDIGASSSVAYNGTGATQAGMGVDWGDYDNDGKLDLVITNFENEPKPIYHNDGDDVFRDRSLVLGVANKTTSYLGFGVKWLDVTNDGWLDLLIANGHVNDNVAEHEKDRTYRQLPQLFRNEAGTHFTEISNLAGPGLQQPIVGRGLAIGDYDNDGRIDALMVDAQGAPLLLHNESAPTGHWLLLELEGVKSNRDGYGALVSVEAGGLKQVRLCHADGSYLSSSDKRVHIGLGGSPKAERLSVRWCDGHTDVYKDVPADQILHIREGAAHVQPLPSDKDSSSR